MAMQVHLVTAFTGTDAASAGSHDKDATVRVKAVGSIGHVVAEAACSETSQEELTLMLTSR